MARARVVISMAVVTVIVLVISLGGSKRVSAAGTPPAIGDVVFNEYRSTNNGVANDFFELLILGTNVDLRGVRVSDNELNTPDASFEIGEAVFIFNDESYLADLPAGTIVTVWTKPDGVMPDTTLDPPNGDWELGLTHDTGVTANLADGLGYSPVIGLDSADALYLYLPGGDGDSTGSNEYLDFIGWGGHGAAVPTGITGLTLGGAAHNGYFTGSSLAAKNNAANWVEVTAANADVTTPGAANTGQDLSSLRTPNAIELLTFTAQPTADGSVQLTWETASEYDMAAFNILRGQQPDGSDAQRVNAQPIAALGQNGLGNRYHYTDHAVAAGRHLYFLEALNVRQEVARYGPLMVNVGAPTAVTLGSAAGAADSQRGGWLVAALLLATAVLPRFGRASIADRSNSSYNHGRWFYQQLASTRKRKQTRL